MDRRRLDQLLEAALELSGAEREAFLARECSSPEELEALARLIASAEATAVEPGLAGALWQELAASRGPQLEVGARLGAYRIVGPLGRGGMAVVYLAERADGAFEQKVALKILERPADDELAVRRFHLERQILARLEHPNIARLIDGGIAPDGRPYFVMERVEGQAIDRFCNQKALSLGARLRLFTVVGQAVAAAHRQLVVHRDIKPSNILVTEDGTPKLLDFGIAKLLEAPAEGEEQEGLTRAWARVMTPEYASPEQWAGKPVSTASDVYQLGLLLYELLVGERAFHFAGSTPSELQATAPHRQPPRPSTAVTHDGREGSAPRAQERARQRGCNSPRALGKLLVGDLDTIVLAALRPEAERRYDSASRLVEDVERFLAGQPILARKDSLGYRARKFVGRNRFIVAASAAALAALVGLSAFYTARLARERDVAEREAAKARQVSEFLAGLFHGPDPYSRQQSGELTALQLLDEGTQHLETELGDQPEVKASLLHTLAEVYRRLGRHEPAEKLIDQAVELRRVALGPDHPDTLESLQRQGVILRGLDQLDRAIPIVRQVAAGWERLYGPNDERLAMALADLALMLERNHQIPEARPLIERAIGIFERAQPVNYDRLSQAHWVLGEIFANGGDSAAGIRETRIAIQLLREKVDPDHPRLGGLLSDLAYDLDGLGHLEQAHAVYADALATVEKRLGPGNSHTDWIRMNAARVELALGEPARALAMIDQSLPGLTAAFGPNHYSVAEARLVRAGALLAESRPQEALAELDRARAPLADSYGEASTEALDADQLRAQAFVQLARPAEAEALFAKVAPAAARAEAPLPWSQALYHLARLHLEAGKPAAAAAELEQAEKAVVAGWPQGSVRRVRVLALLARARLAAGDLPGARAALAQAQALAGQVEGVLAADRAELEAVAAELARRP